MMELLLIGVGPHHILNNFSATVDRKKEQKWGRRRLATSVTRSNSLY